MKRKLVFSLLLISLAFNVAFISVFVYHRLVVRRMMPPMGGPPPPEHFQKHMQHLKPLNEDFHKQKQDFLRFLVSEDFDEDEAIRKLEETNSKQMVMEREMGIKLIEMRMKMTPEEAVKFFKNRFQNKRQRRRRK